LLQPHRTEIGIQLRKLSNGYAQNANTETSPHANSLGCSSVITRMLISLQPIA